MGVKIYWMKRAEKTVAKNFAMNLDPLSVSWSPGFRSRKSGM